ncbi:hypothetical protein EUTSA_v10029380mg [Eutrema salsugineum]|uniref:MADS-box domain-containing protein n=1 Tax=Eutrema salsugineum TaxID=72664 RepID=V4L7G0_EUTSA|nr:agamous-like MADS-box protein AGL97 [Eutrema salsugineum]ESQ38277.1 hypothetical protein EUTSA_v10029380mg [Eutrema salsugineum]
MVKRGGNKRKIPMEKITKKESLATAFTKRSYGLFSKASQLCLLSDAQIAVLATPPSSHSHVSFFSFGHSSVDSLVSDFLKGKRPLPVAREGTREEDIGVILARKDLGLGLWWEDEVLAQSENPQELNDAMKSMSTLLRKFKELREGEAVRSNPNSDRTLIPQTLIPQTLIPDDDLPASFNENTEEQSKILAICESFRVTEEKNNINNNNDDKDLTGSLEVGCDQEVDIDQLIDFNTAFDASAFDDCLLESTEENTTEF